MYYVKKDNDAYKIYSYNNGNNKIIGTSSSSDLVLKDDLYYINNNFLYSFDGKVNSDICEANKVMKIDDFIYLALSNDSYSDLYYLKNNDKVLIDKDILLSLGLVKLENK